LDVIGLGDTLTAGGGAADSDTWDATGFSFKSAGTTAGRIIYFYIPRLTLQEAASLSSQDKWSLSR
jgi:hypothetical protein